jgi:hypothetical protein
VTLLDERGRLAGRFNAVDAAAGIVLLVLIPLALGAYLLFRTPAPTLHAIVPATIVEGPNQRLEIDGANLRPFMRVTLGSTPANSFLLGSTKYALVDLPVLRPGAYDVVLYDFQREVARLPGALTVAPLATDVELNVDGVFKEPSSAARGYLKAGAKLPTGGLTTGEVLVVGDAVSGQIRLRIGDQLVAVPHASSDIPGTVRLHCYTVKGPEGIAQCAVPNGGDRTLVSPGALITWTLPDGPVVFQIAAAHPAQNRSEPR